MSTVEIQLLEVLIALDRNNSFIDRDALAPVFNHSWELTSSFLSHLEQEGYITILYGDDDIFRISLVPSAYARLQSLKEQTSLQSLQNNSISIGQNFGALSFGDNRGAAINIQNISFQLKQDIRSDLLNVFSSIDHHSELSSVDSVQIKELLRQIIKCLEQSEQPPRNLLAVLSARIQKHSWLASPLAATLIRFLETLW